jgi:hypothetical protein
MPYKSQSDRRANLREWHKRNPGKQKEYDAKRQRSPENVRKWRLKQEYGITHDEYLAMYEQQGGRCAICGGKNRSGNLLSVDHDHKTGKVRGLLCNACNWMLGHAKDNIQTLASAIHYLGEGNQ